MPAAEPWSELARSIVMLDGIRDVFAAGWKSEYVWQVGAFALAVAAAWLIVRVVKKQARNRPQPAQYDSFCGRLLRRLDDVIGHIAFSVIAASILWLLVRVIEATGLVSCHSSLVFAHLGYLVFYSFALLRLILYALRGMLGSHLVTAGLTRVITWFFWILVVLEFAGVLPEILRYMETQTIPIGSETLTLWTAFSGAVSVFLTLGVANLFAGFVESALDRSPTLAPNLKVVFGRICRWILMVAAVLFAMRSVGIDLTVLSVFGGAFGVGLGFGLQKIASNYVSGFIILLDHSVEIGDYVEIGGFKGKIKEINTRYTVIRDSCGVDNIVPNETFVTGSLKNYYHSDNLSVVVIRISVSYGCDLNRAMAILSEEANRPERVDKSRRGWTGITSLGDSGVDLEAGVWVPNVGDGTLGLRTQVLLNVLRRYGEEGIEVPFPQLDICVRDAAGEALSVEKLATALAAVGERKNPAG